MTESNTYCKKNPAECTDFELAIIRVRIGTFESVSQLDLEHWENESRARVGALRNKSRARVGALGNEIDSTFIHRHKIGLHAEI